MGGVRGAWRRGRKLGLALVLLSAVSLVLLCCTLVRLSQVPAAELFTTQGHLAPNYHLDAWVALNCVCGVMGAFEGAALLAGRLRAARALLPVSFVLVVLPYAFAVVSDFAATPLPFALLFAVANIPFCPLMLASLVVLAMVVRRLREGGGCGASSPGGEVDDWRNLTNEGRRV